MPESIISAQLEQLAARGSKLLLAVSGGADSMALLRLVHESGWPAEVASVNHGLRAEAAGEVEFVRRACEALNLEFHAASFDTAAVARHRGWNLEETARTLRYQHLAAIARAAGAAHVVTAHTQDDQTETVLMQLLRGAAWLTGMPARTGLVIRPLLNLRKQALVDWLNEIGQDWREDRSNFDTRFERAWLRNQVLPLLRARHADLDERVADLRGLQAQQKEFLDAAARPFVGLDGGLDAARLRDRPTALQHAAIAHLLKAHGVPFGLERLERISRAVVAGENWRESVGSTRQLRLYDDRLEVVVARDMQDASVIRVSEAAQLPAGVDAAALGLPDLVMRTRQAGDRIRMSAGSRKVSDVLIDAKIPREDRDSLQVLASGGEVVWVEGVATAAGYAAERVPGAADFMLAALGLAEEAAAAGELPVGAVVVHEGKVIASARNESEGSRDPTAHAEMLAIRRAAAAIGDWRLTDCTLYVTLEPCAMCFGAMLQSHLGKVVYAAGNRREGATGTVADLDLLPWKRKVAVSRGPLAREAAALLSEFFRNRRNGSS